MVESRGPIRGSHVLEPRAKDLGATPGSFATECGQLGPRRVSY